MVEFVVSQKPGFFKKPGFLTRSIVAKLNPAINQL